VKLSPRYSAPPVLVFDDEPQAVLAPLVRQRERLEALLDDLSADEWHAPSRCDGWTVKDLVAHLVSVNNYWTFSIGAGVAGTPSRALATFDPVAVPAALAAADAGTPAVEMAERFRASNRAFCDLVRSLDADQWSVLAECPVGHVSTGVVAHHALWDFLIHEWDIALPLGRAQIAEDDEVSASLSYAAALNGALVLLGGATVASPLAIETTHPRAAVVLETGESVTVSRADGIHGAPCWRDDAVALLEALSVRAPIPTTTPHEWRAVLAGLRETFDQPGV
jgi:uncharacterized protein (TIGR03083 family)